MKEKMMTKEDIANANVLEKIKAIEELKANISHLICSSLLKLLPDNTEKAIVDEIHLAVLWRIAFQIASNSAIDEVILDCVADAVTRGEVERGKKNPNKVVNGCLFDAAGIKL